MLYGSISVKRPGISLVVQWLGPCAFTAKVPGSVPGRGTEIQQATCAATKKKKKKSKRDKSIETESRLVVARGWAGLGVGGLRLDC